MNKRILVVDDSPEILALFRELLTEEGYTVITQHYPIESADQVRGVAPDLIILDHWAGNREVSGASVTRIRQAADLAHIPVIICTGFVDAPEVQATRLREQHLQVLSKPFDIVDLFDMVELMITMAEAGGVRDKQQIIQPAID